MPAKAKTKKVSPKPSSVVEDPVAVSAESPVVASPQIDEPAPVVEENLEEMLEEDGDDSALEAKNNMLYLGGAVGTIAIIVVTLGIFVIFLNAPKVKKQMVVEEVAVQATPTPTPMLKTTIAIEVLNGSGVAGAASRAAVSLVDKGYTVVSTGNTKKQDTTQLFVAKNVPSDVAAVLFADFSALFDISSNSGELTDSTASARLVIGTK
jgi:hypothetical protein